jgi:hypothetical protein
MPTILRKLGFQFYFFANEHLPRHIHIQKNEDYARFDLERLKFTECTFKGKDLRSLKNIINEHQDYFRRSWDEYFGN